MAKDKKPDLTLVQPSAAGLARLYQKLTGKAATEEEMQALLDAERAKQAK